MLTNINNYFTAALSDKLQKKAGIKSTTSPHLKSVIYLLPLYPVKIECFTAQLFIQPE